MLSTIIGYIDSTLSDEIQVSRNFLSFIRGSRFELNGIGICPNMAVTSTIGVSERIDHVSFAGQW